MRRVQLLAIQPAPGNFLYTSGKPNRFNPAGTPLCLLCGRRGDCRRRIRPAICLHSGAVRYLFCRSSTLCGSGSVRCRYDGGAWPDTSRSTGAVDRSKRADSDPDTRRHHEPTEAHFGHSLSVRCVAGARQERRERGHLSELCLSSGLRSNPWPYPGAASDVAVRTQQRVPLGD